MTLTGHVLQAEASQWQPRHGWDIAGCRKGAKLLRHCTAAVLLGEGFLRRVGGDGLNVYLI